MKSISSRVIFSIYIAIFIISITLVSAFLLVFYNVSISNLNQSVEARLESNIRSAALLIDYDAHERIIAQSGSPEENPELYSEGTEYSQIRFDMNEFAHEVDATFIYTVYFDLDAQKMYIAMDGSYNPEDWFYNGQEYEADYSFFIKAYNTPGQVFISDIEDSTGSFKTAIWAIAKEDNGQSLVSGVICVDISDSFLSSLSKTFLTIFFLLLSIMIIFYAIIGVFLVKLLKRNSLMRKKIEGLAYFDSLTSLPNRTSLMNTLAEYIRICDEQRDFGIALFFIDIDNFKQVNDMEGHISGDFLLQDIANFLTRFSREFQAPGRYDKIKEFVARLGGDEFVLLHPAKNIESAEVFIKSLIDAFHEIIAEDSIMTRHSVSMSVGLAYYPQHADDISSLLKRADTAMYAAKNSGKNSYAIYSDS